MKRKILLTGATGLVGSHILLDLLKQNATLVYALKREKSDLSALKNLFEWYDCYPLLENINWINGDLSSNTVSEVLPTEIDEIIHTAAVVSFNPDDYEVMNKVNINATKTLLNYASKSGVSKFGFISSIAALGRMDASGRYTENSEWVENDSNSYYSKTKYEAEKAVIAANNNGVNTYIVNPGVILGPCDWNKSSGTFFRTGAKGIAFYTKGQNGFVDVRDVSRGMLDVMKNGSSGERHILVGESVPYRKIFSDLCVQFGKKPPRIYSPKWLTELGWRLDKVKSKLKGVPPTLTEETARNANGIFEYDNAKITSRGFEFTPITQSIEDSVPFFKQYYF
ncbi:NAD-dependent epimerase/dehydratase family protein [Parvicella tangerina]|uniref:NAD-dependent epimerase/dehydratase family protein n=1 Tax=Parvicella tangerina TaxID=2829795 RepID=UPI00215B9F6D|nr:NAD-dependent epimerase/dehydratase family protein [Parvicella tangerina]